MLKVLVAGESFVGKTTLIQRFIADKFITGIRNTIGVDFFLKSLKFSDIAGLDEDSELNLQVWDISGEQRFREILPLYLPGTQGVVLCFDNKENLEKLQDWETVISDLIPKEIPRILIRTKIDLEDVRIQDELIKDMKNKYNWIGPFNTSAKSGDGVKKAFNELAILILDRMKSGLIN